MASRRWPPVLAIPVLVWLLGCSAPAPTPLPTKPTAAVTSPASTAGGKAGTPTKEAVSAPAKEATSAPAKDKASTSAKVEVLKPLDPPVTVKGAGGRNVVEIGYYAGIEHGYFAEQGINIELEFFDNATKSIPQLATDQIQTGQGAINAGLFNAIARGLDLRIAAPVARYEPGFSGVNFLVRKGLADAGAIKDYKDLKGKSIAVSSTGSSMHFMVFKALEKGGLKFSDVNLIELPFPDMVTALANQAIDVALISEPSGSLAVQRGFAVLWRQASDVAPGIQATVMLFSPQMVRNAELGKRWMVAYLKGVREYNDAFVKNKGREEVISILQKHTTAKDRALYDLMVFPILDPNGKLNVASIKEQFEWFRSMGRLEGNVNIDSVIDTRFAEYAVSVIGEYR